MLSDVTRFFKNPHTCEKLIFQIRWPDGRPVCPACAGHRVVSIPHYNNLRCKDCYRQFSLKHDTLFENSPLDLGQWFLCLYVLIHDQGITCNQLADLLSVTLKTAWRMKRKLNAGLSLICPSDNFYDILRQLIFLKKSEIYAVLKPVKSHQKPNF